MKRFLCDTDYSDQIRDEILNLMEDETGDNPNLRQAEEKAVAQMKMRLSGRYDIEKIFAVDTTDRNAFIVMTAIDITLYHLWSRERGKMPDIRNERYQDAIDWLKGVAGGTEICDLPLKNTPYGGGVQIWSRHKPNDNKY